MIAADFIEILKQVNIMEEQRFWGVLALFLVGLVIYLQKHRVKAKERTDVAEIESNSAKLKEVLKFGKVAMIVGAITFIAKS